METKYNVGDKVKILPHASVGYRKSGAGDIVTIMEYPGYRQQEHSAVFYDTNGDDWYEREVELVEKKSFTKSDLKDWMIVEFRGCCDPHVVHLPLKRFLGLKGGYLLLDGYEADLTHADYSKWDVVRVYSSKYNYKNSISISIDKGELLWERVEKSPQQLEIESIRKEQVKLAERLKELEKDL